MSIEGPDHAPFPFIVGAGRSGSTLLRAMLDSHPDMAIPGETYLLAQLARHRTQFMRDGVFDREAFEGEVFSDSRFWVFYITDEDVRAEFDRVPPAGLADAVRGLYRAHARSVGKTRWADKTPIYARSANQIADLLPEACFVHLHRDPREVVASYLDANWSYRTPSRAAAYWRVSVEGALDVERKHQARSIRVSYDDLVANPERALRRICEVAQISFTPSMLDYTGGRVARVTSTMDGDAHTNLLRPPKAVRDWRAQLRPGQVLRIQVMTQALMSELGYETAPVPWSPARLFAELERLVVLPLTRLELWLRDTRVVNKLRPRLRKMARRPTTVDAMREKIELASK